MFLLVNVAINMLPRAEDGDLAGRRASLVEGRVFSKHPSELALCFRMAAELRLISWVLLYCSGY